jgi:hydroxyacylglutathione hydrolase
MIVERIWANNSLRNYHYLVGCGETGEALAIDPLDWEACLSRARALGWTIRQIVNTHEHHDHTDGNRPLVGVTGAQVLAHAAAASVIGGVDRGLAAGDVIRVGKSVELECLDTPGHTRSHVCLLAHGDEAALFSGDTLFNAGVGNCMNGGDPDLLYQTCSRQLARLPEHTRIHPGHDYLQNNVGFTLSVEPDNADAARWRLRLRLHDPVTAPVLTLAEERGINTFFRLDAATVIAGLRVKVPQLAPNPTDRDVFVALRQLRNSW